MAILQPKTRYIHICTVKQNGIYEALRILIPNPIKARFNIFASNVLNRFNILITILAPKSN